MTNLVFMAVDGQYVCSLPAEGEKTGVVQITQTERGMVSVFANVEGMEKCYLGTYANNLGNSLIFALDLPDGLEVTIESATEVTNAVWMQ